MTEQTVPKTILFLITQSDWGGAQKNVFDLASELKPGYKIMVAGGEQGATGELAQKLRAENIAFIPLKHTKRAISPLYDFLSLFELTKIIKQTKPDIIHLHSSKISITGSIAGWIAKLTIVDCRLSIVYTVHGWVFNEPMPIWKKLFYKYAEKFTALFKDKLICVSEFDRQIAIREKICPKQKLITVHNGIKNIDFLSPEDARKKIGELLNIKYEIINNKLIIGSIGNLYQTKGFEYFIEAIDLIRRSLPEFIAVIIGHGNEEKILKKMLAEKKLSDNIFFIEIKSGAANFLKAFDIYFSSSVKEGLAYTIVEAMQAELPIVATKVGGTPEMIEHGVTGLLVNSGDARALGDGILELIIEKEKNKKMAFAAKSKADEEFSLKAMIAKTKEVYYN